MNTGRILALAAVLAGLPTSAAVAAPAGAMQIGWNDLRPTDTAAGQDAEEGLSWNLNGRTVEIAGYALPSDREGDLVYQFLLIPWSGLCAHVPPPPANQAVLINLKRPYKLSEIYETVSVTGTLQSEFDKTQLFILDGVSVIESGYRIAGARVAPAEKISGGARPPQTTPWSFVRQ